jgi:hypothetical protein
MSYEGYAEFLCKSGHYWTMSYSEESFLENRSAPNIYTCPHCGLRPSMYHDVNETNGIDEDDPNTLPAKKKEIGFDDEWRIDHYGNKYAVKIIKFKPIGKHWKNWT